jgi:hypothetical protein
LSLYYLLLVCYFLVIGLCFLILFSYCFLVLYFCFLFCVFCVRVLFCVLCLLLYIAVFFLFLFRFTDHCHQVETIYILPVFVYTDAYICHVSCVFVLVLFHIGNVWVWSLDGIPRSLLFLIQENSRRVITTKPLTPSNT